MLAKHRFAFLTFFILAAVITLFPPMNGYGYAYPQFLFNSGTDSGCSISFDRMVLAYILAVIVAGLVGVVESRGKHEP